MSNIDKHALSGFAAKLTDSQAEQIESTFALFFFWFK